MRKNIKNDKVLRAITIGLATMIAATSVPTNVYAGDEEQGTQDDVNESKEEDTEESVEVQVSGDISEAQPVVEAAQVTADNLTGGDLMSEELTTPLIDAALAGPVDEAAAAALNEAAMYINGAEADPEAGTEAVTGVKNDLAALNDLMAAPEQTVAPENADAQTEESQQTVTVDPFAISSGNVLPTDENADLTYGEDRSPEFVDANNRPILVDNEYFSDPQVAGVSESYNKAIEAIENKDLDSAKSYAAEADAKVEAAQNTVDVLKNAIQDSAAAAAAAKQAQEKADTLKAARDAYYNQYNALMIQYYRDNNNLGENTVYNPDGTLDAKGSAEALATKLGENGKGNRSQEVMMLGRDLLKKMVTFSISQYDDVDPDSIVFGVEVNKDAKGKEAKYDDEGNLILDKTPNECKMLEGKVFESDDNASDGVHGLEQVVTTYARAERGSKVKNLQPNAIQGMNWYEYPSVNDGRDHRVKVTYKDNDGNEHEEYYNYIFKNPAFDTEETDNSKGIIYVLKEVEENGERKQVPFGTLDDYDLLKAAGETQAKVKAAADEVNNLRAQILEIARIATSGIELENDGPAEENLSLDDLQAILEAKLEIAQSALDNSKANLKALNQLIDYLGVTGFPEEEGSSEDSDDSDDTSDDAAGGETVIPGPGGFTYTIPGGFTLPATLLDGTTGTTGGTTTGSGVLGVRTDGGTEADEGGVADSRTNVAPRADFGTVNKVLGSRQNKDNSQIVKKIKDNEIPLAEIPNMDDEVTMNWMWLLIIFLLGATGKKMYDEYKKKKEAEEAAKINK